VLLVDLYPYCEPRCPSSIHFLHSLRGRVYLTVLTLTISPVAFLTFRRPRKKYQNRDLATVSLGEKMVMRYMSGVGLASVGRWRPTTSYS
jgi:hypothetical protein